MILWTITEPCLNRAVRETDTSVVRERDGGFAAVRMECMSSAID